MTTKDVETVSLWELSCERKKRSGLLANRVTLAIVAPNLSEAMARAEMWMTDQWVCWSARHVGHRVVLAPPPNSEEKT